MLNIKSFAIIFVSFGWLLVSSSHAEINHREQSIYTVAAFGPDHRLWRLNPSQNFVSVDYSSDYGKTFSRPVVLNQKPQAINHWDENPPTIAVAKNGWIYVLYFADDRQANSSFFSYSSDGKHFSKPVKISANADVDYQYQAEMLLAQDGKTHFIWHDTRDKALYKQDGGGDLSLFYLRMNSVERKQQSLEKRIAKNVCSCCRSSMALDNKGDLVILARFVYPGNIRDHGLVKVLKNGQVEEPMRSTFDDWELEGCPTHGPALSISRDGRYHMAWFTLGKKRSGLFYAWSDDNGKSFSSPYAFGRPDHLPSRPEVLALGAQLALTWKEFDGASTQIFTMLSNDGGQTWSQPKLAADSESPSAHPSLLSDGKRIFLAWSSLDSGFRLQLLE